MFTVSITVQVVTRMHVMLLHPQYNPYIIFSPENALTSGSTVKLVVK